MTRWWFSLGLAAALHAGALPKFALQDTAGTTHNEAEWQTASGVVLYFLTTDCPVSNGYVPEMNRIAKEYQSRGVRFYGVIADTGTPLADVRQHVQEFAYTFPILLDPRQTLVKITNAEVTPEAALLARGGELMYLGRIDNRVESFSVHRQQATQHELRDALDAVLAGKRPAKATAPAVGCTINRVSP